MISYLTNSLIQLLYDIISYKSVNAIIVQFFHSWLIISYMILKYLTNNFIILDDYSSLMVTNIGDNLLSYKQSNTIYISRYSISKKGY